jgi:hypothetical protein
MTYWSRYYCLIHSRTPIYNLRDFAHSRHTDSSLEPTILQPHTERADVYVLVEVIRAKELKLYPRRLQYFLWSEFIMIIIQHHSATPRSPTVIIFIIIIILLYFHWRRKVAEISIWNNIYLYIFLRFIFPLRVIVFRFDGLRRIYTPFDDTTTTEA